MIQLDDKMFFDKKAYSRTDKNLYSLFLSEKYLKWIRTTQTGKDILLNLDGKTSIDDIIKLIATQYELPKDLIKNDILNFVNSAYDKGVITHCSKKLIIPSDDTSCDNLFFSITNYCNKSCLYCYEKISNEKRNSSFITLDTIKRTMEYLYPSGRCNNTRIYLTGGEPLAHENLLVIINYLRTFDAQIGIFSNGSLLTNELARKLSDYNIFMFLSLDSANSDTNDYIRGKNSFAEVMHASSILHANNIPFFFATTLSDINMCELNQLIPLAQQCHSLGLYLNEPIKTSKIGKVFSNYFSYSYQEYNEIIYD